MDAGTYEKSLTSLAIRLSLQSNLQMPSQNCSLWQTKRLVLAFLKSSKVVIMSWLHIYSKYMDLNTENHELLVFENGNRENRKS